jgi:hypothetical protein
MGRTLAQSVLIRDPGFGTVESPGTGTCHAPMSVRVYQWGSGLNACRSGHAHVCRHHDLHHVRRQHGHQDLDEVLGLVLVLAGLVLVGAFIVTADPYFGCGSD